jgi:hypothetical protein
MENAEHNRDVKMLKRRHNRDVNMLKRSQEGKG